MMITAIFVPNRLPVLVSLRKSGHGMALNITVQGYRDQLEFGLIAGANILPDVQRLADMLEEELVVLERAFEKVAA